VKPDSDPILSAEVAIGRLLRGGVLFSGGLILVGGLLRLRVFLNSGLDLSVHSGTPDLFTLLRRGQEIPNEMLWSPHGTHFFGLLGSGQPNAWIVLGVLVLVGLPMIRVALAGFVFFLQKDYLFVLFCIVVLMNLMIGFLSHSIA
jgi:uncharacterized membrane protein